MVPQLKDPRRIYNQLEMKFCHIATGVYQNCNYPLFKKFQSLSDHAINLLVGNISWQTQAKRVLILNAIQIRTSWVFKRNLFDKWFLEVYESVLIPDYFKVPWCEMSCRRNWNVFKKMSTVEESIKIVITNQMADSNITF